MITALLLPLFLIGTPADAAVPAVRSAGGDDPAVQIWISDNRRLLQGDHAKVQVRAREDSYLLVLHVDPDGHLRVLFPLDPNDDNFVRGGRKYEIRGRGGRESFTADDGKGRGTVYAAVSHDPFRFDQFVLGDHWDYRQLAPQPLSAEPEQELNELVRRMADGSFDYDLLTYDVLERVVYANDYYSGSAYDSYGCGYSYYGCGRSYYGSPFSLSVGLFFGRPFYRRHYYDPFYAAYDPFYDPYFYDPYYYRPYVYQVRSYGYPYYNYPYGGYYHTNRYRGSSRPYTPYRFRPADGINAGYRDRRYDLRRSVNTVYIPPKVRGREPLNANPIRRLTNERDAAEARPRVERRANAPAGDARSPRTPERGAPARRADRGGDSRLVRPNVEARRARAPEERRTIVPDSREAGGRRDLPTEVRPRSRPDDTPRRAVVERPVEVRGADVRTEPRAEPRQAEPRRAEPVRPDPQPQSRPEARPSDRGGDRGGDRGSYSPPPRSDGGAARGGGSGGGGNRGGGDRGGGGGDRGGARRR
jgi:uncharacterized membrane protein YgcG